MDNIKKIPLALLGTLSIFSLREVCSSLRPYYIHFPPPVIPGLNRIPPYAYPSPWLPSNSTFSRSFQDGPIPLIWHTWVKPDTSERIKLENGTIIYYVSPPWGGFRSSSPSTTIQPQTTTPLSNSLSESDDLSALSPGGNEIERQSLFEDPNRQGGYANSVAGPQALSIDITTPSPNKNANAWDHGQIGVSWSPASQMNDKLPETTTSTSTSTTTNTNPTRSSVGNNPTTIPDNKTTTLKTTTEEATTTTTVDPVAASTNARFPVSESVRKFRRIVAQIRAITKKELVTKTSKS